MTTALQFEEFSADYFGSCPDCGKNDGYINIGRSHWFYCEAHKVKWCAGSNLFGGWRYETEEEQRATYEALGFGEFRRLDREDDWCGHPDHGEGGRHFRAGSGDECDLHHGGTVCGPWPTH